MKSCVFIDTENKDKDKKLFEIVEKLYKDGKKILIYTSTFDRAKELDRILWVLKQESFLPHKIFKYEEKEALEPIAIVYDQIKPINTDILVIDSPCSMEFAAKFANIFDFVDRTNKETLVKSRERYASFQKLGYVMEYEK